MTWQNERDLLITPIIISQYVYSYYHHVYRIDRTAAKNIKYKNGYAELPSCLIHAYIHPFNYMLVETHKLAV